MAQSPSASAAPPPHNQDACCSVRSSFRICDLLPSHRRFTMRCSCQNTWIFDGEGDVLQLCEDCLAVFARDDVISSFKSGLTYMRESQQLGRVHCSFCHFLSARYFRSSVLFPNDAGGDGDFTILRKLLSWLGSGRLTCRIRGDLKLDQPLQIKRWDGWWPIKTKYLRLSALRDSPFADTIASRPVITDLRSDGTFAMVQKWLANCDEQHDCFKNQPPVKRPPTHLINVNAPGHGPETVVLENIKSESSDPYPIYAALSYVWGSSQSYMTTSKNYQSYQQGISISSLGEGLQDAIWVTRKIGLKYLWIDALCIIQDDIVDKMQEIARMDSIYTFAHITLSASSTCSCTHSFLSNKRRGCIHRLSGVEVPLGPNGHKAHLRIMDRKDDGYNIEWREELEPIHHRAWTFQEHFMSSRMLLFKDFQVFWVCSKMRGRDGGWMAPDEEQSYGQQWNLSRRTLQSPTLKDWLTICRTYAGRKLTDPNDKLSALSSIASYFAVVGNDSYAAGIWMTDFQEQLAWKAKNLGSTSRPKSWTAPSWSWASLNCPISFPSQDFEDRVVIPYLSPRIVSWQVEPVSAHAKFGQLKSASLQICGRMLKCQPTRHEEGYERGYDLVVEDQSVGNGVVELGSAQLFFDYDVGPLPSEISTIQGIEPWNGFVYCLLLRVEVSERVAKQLPRNITRLQDDEVEALFCLAIRQLENGDFYRVGRAAMHPDYKSQGWLNAFQEEDEKIIRMV
ncbi:heterokaryon incompatibility protein-domain-containing protein [Paraphoma chrysanthemicola]|uniref:Heterokaryon incompatibility protein-domain-containing protein n=1 Tax=Paraphoma chrysanthemicola TaxID=798071 RepID=A0A8K0VVD5_9PLEO|nr:heterokaryon incompatibility protein-domain-containing protein [Paraphoma chrysanthemicola]